MANPQSYSKSEMQKDGKIYVKFLFMMSSSEPRVAQVMATAPADEFSRIEEPFKLMLASVRLGKATRRHDGGPLLHPRITGWLETRQAVRTAGPLLRRAAGFPCPAENRPLAVANLNEKATNFKEFVKAKNLRRNHYTDLKELESTFLKIDGFDANISHVSAARSQ